MLDAAEKNASYQDVLDAPEHLVAQIIDGELLLHPRPSALHAMASSALGEELGPPFKRGRGGPGGWILLDEPELHLASDIIVPDLAGWRRDRMAEIPDAPYFTLAPDWACEVLSPSTHRIDRIGKTRIYARENVRHVWLVDPRELLVEVLRLDGDSYRIVASASGDDKAELEPFAAIALDLAILWAR